ncbi:MAG: response regulator [Rhodomicrobium sp.]
MPLNGHRILLVEDEVLIALEVKSIVREAHGEIIAHAPSLPRAMKLADTPNLSLAILDFWLGSKDSLPVAAKLRAAGVPFIFHTASNVPVLSEIWPRVPIVPKPATSGRLVSTLVSLVAKRPSYFAA